MSNTLYPERDRRSLLPMVVYFVMGLIVVVAIGMPLFQSHYIYPRFIKLIIANTESEAIRTGRHFLRVVMKHYDGGSIAISNEMKAYLDAAGKDYNLWKIKIFGATGKTIYSTDGRDIGQLNSYPYFHQIVAKGVVHTKVVRKNTKSLEGQIVSNDVVETYIPILEKGEFLGAFELYYNITARKAAMDHVVLRTNILIYSLTAIIVLAAIATGVGFRRWMRVRKQYEDALYDSATKDALTGVFNRRRLNELLQWEVDKHIRYQTGASLLMVDIDHFKTVNDTYGHLAGDDVLVNIAQVCQTLLRESDYVARYGGEEFVVLLPETGKRGAFGVAEKIRQTVKAAATPTAAGAIHVTVSIGVVDFYEVASISFEKVIKLADDCLFYAKSCGRNKVCTSDEILEPNNSDLQYRCV